MSELLSSIFTLQNFIEYWYIYIIAVIVGVVLVVEIIKALTKGLAKMIIYFVKQPFILLAKYPVVALILLLGLLVYIGVYLL